MAKGLLAAPPTGKPRPRRQQQRAPMQGLTAGQTKPIRNIQAGDTKISGLANRQFPAVQESFSQPFDWNAVGPQPGGPDWSGVPGLPGVPDFGQGPALYNTDDWGQFQNDQVAASEAAYNAATDQDFADEQQAFEQRMANRGIPMGSELYDKEQAKLVASKANAKLQNRAQAYNTSASNASQFGNLALNTRGQATGEQVAGFGMGLQANQQGNANVANQYGLNQQAYQDRYGNQMQRRMQPLQDFNALRASVSGQPMQNLGYSQTLGAQNNQAANQLNVARGMPRGGGDPYNGFASYQDLAAFEDARKRSNLQFDWANNPQYQQGGGPSFGAQLGGGILGQAAGGWGQAGFPGLKDAFSWAKGLF